MRGRTNYFKTKKEAKNFLKRTLNTPIKTFLQGKNPRIVKANFSEYVGSIRSGRVGKTKGYAISYNKK